jgi:hypothetical protein
MDCSIIWSLHYLCRTAYFFAPEKARATLMEAGSTNFI